LVYFTASWVPHKEIPNKETRNAGIIQIRLFLVYFTASWVPNRKIPYKETKNPGINKRTNEII